MPVHRPRAFTLIELLVVIAIIALLIGILLPALGRARNASRLAVSLSNIRQILIAQHSYRFERKDAMPQCGNGYAANGTITGGWDTWEYGGKDCGPYWATGANAAFDEPAYCRPLNGYLYTEMTFDVPPSHVGAHTGGAHTPGHPVSPPSGTRGLQELPVFKSPGDKLTRQGTQWPNIDPARPISSYDDVGTSYHLNMKWWDQPGLPAAFTQHYNEGVRRIKLASEYDPTAKFVWIHDQTTDVVANAPWNQPFKVLGEFGDFNKSVHGYMDGHGQYNTVIPGFLYDGEMINGRWQLTGKYTYIFTLPGQGMPSPHL